MKEKQRKRIQKPEDGQESGDRGQKEKNQKDKELDDLLQDSQEAISEAEKARQKGRVGGE